jgi:aspartyl-tRNA(Asn)/glutamyl-tRNA(Gln) amidotransferase subunit C
MIDPKEIEKIASLARLRLTDSEKAGFATQLSAVLESFQKIASIDTAQVQPLITPTDVEFLLREDIVEAWSGAEVATANAPEKSGHLFKVPPVV